MLWFLYGLWLSALAVTIRFYEPSPLLSCRHRLLLPSRHLHLLLVPVQKKQLPPLVVLEKLAISGGADCIWALTCSRRHSPQLLLLPPPTFPNLASVAPSVASSTSICTRLPWGLDLGTARCVRAFCADECDEDRAQESFPSSLL